MTPSRTTNMSVHEFMIWVMHRFSEVFREHAVLKGGMQLMLLSSERATNDLDYVFVPFTSKKDIAARIEEVLVQLPDARVRASLHSSSGRFLVTLGETSVQIEFNVSTDVPTEPLTTELLARKAGVLPRVIRVMSKDVAMANKLAAWNERRLARDLYDIYYWYAHLDVLPDQDALNSRLAKISSRLPKFKNLKHMSQAEFWKVFQNEVHNLDEKDFLVQLGPLLPAHRLEGLMPVLKVKLSELAYRY